MAKPKDDRQERMAMPSMREDRDDRPTRQQGEVGLMELNNRHVQMIHDPDREWFVALGITVGLDEVFSHFKLLFPDSGDIPYSVRPIINKICSTLEEMHEQIFTEDRMPDGVCFVDTNEGDEE